MQAPQEPPAVPRTPPSLLLVDDEEPILRALRRTFGADYRIETAADGAAGLAAARLSPPDVVIADQSMPHMSGVELLARLRAEMPATLRILITGYTDYGSLVDAVNAAQVHHYFEKPFHAPQLRGVVEQLLAARAPAAGAGHGAHDGLMDAHHFVERVDTEVARSARYGRQFAIVVCRLGDAEAALRAAVPRLWAAERPAGHAAAMRRSDFAALVEGVGLCLVLPETPAAGALIKARRMGTALAAAAAAPAPGVGCGVAAFPRHGTTTAALVHAARTACIAAARRAVDDGAVVVAVAGLDVAESI